MAQMFRRNSFHRFDDKPKWHIADNPPDVKWGTWEARCGYVYNAILSSPMIKAEIKNKKLICSKCLTKEAK